MCSVAWVSKPGSKYRCRPVGAETFTERLTRLATRLSRPYWPGCAVLSSPFGDKSRTLSFEQASTPRLQVRHLDGCRRPFSKDETMNMMTTMGLPPVALDPPSADGHIVASAAALDDWNSRRGVR